MKILYLMKTAVLVVRRFLCTNKNSPARLPAKAFFCFNDNSSLERQVTKTFPGPYDVRDAEMIFMYYNKKDHNNSTYDFCKHH